VEVCILIHVFYPDLLSELVAFAQNFRDVSFDIFINLVDISWTSELQEQVRAICPGAFVMLSHDAGRDVGGFTRLLEHIDIDRYDLFAFLHSKKSPHIAPESGEYWRRGLLRAIAGTPQTAVDCVKAFRENPHIGLIGAKEWRSQDMGKNVEQYERLLDLLGVRGKNRELDYVSGFMFLTRSDVVARLFETLRQLDFEYGGDRDLDFHIDGQIAHGVERAVPALVRQMGYEVNYR
jgi:lipopolysaccharide biosynthesis protein